jgi:hypothetical protein
MTLIVLLAELFGRFIELDLRRLRLSDLLLEIVLLSSRLDSQLLDLEVEFLDLRLVGQFILLHRECILLLLTGSQDPLLQLLLIPIHF